MEKLMILLVVASLAHGSFAAEPSVFARLTPQQRAVVNQIVAKGDAAAAGQNKGWTSLFNLFANTQAPITDASLSGLLKNLKDTGDLPYDALALAVGNCPAVRAAQAKTSRALGDAVAKIAAGSKLAKPGSFAAISRTLATYRAALLKDVADSPANYFGAASACSKSRDGKVAATINRAHTACAASEQVLGNGIFDGIVARAKATAASSKNRAYLTLIKNLNAKTLGGTKGDRDNKYSLAVTLYIWNAGKRTQDIGVIFNSVYAWMSSRK